MKIKNLFRTIIALMAVLAMALTLVVFSACGPADDSVSGPPDDSTNEPKPSPSDAFEITGSTPEITAFLQALAVQEAEYVDFSIKSNATSETIGYEIDNDGEKVTTSSFDYLEEQNSDTYIEGKYNVKDGNGDMSYIFEYTDLFTGSNYTEDLEYNEYSYLKIFLRDWNVFVLEDEKDVADLSDKTLYYLNDFNITQVISGATGDFLGELSVGDLASMLLVPSSALSTAWLADKLGALTLENGKAVADFNLAAYNLVQAVGELLDGIDGQTTLGDVLANETVKTLITAYTMAYTAQDVKDLLDLAVLSALSMEVEEGVTLGDLLEYLNFDVSKLVPAPDANSTVYDYIVKLVGTEEIKNLVNFYLSTQTENNDTEYGEAVLDEEEGAPAFAFETTLDKVPLDTYLNVFAGMSFEELTAMFAYFTQGVTETEISVTVASPTTEIEYFNGEYYDYITFDIPSVYSYTLSDFTVEYTLEDGVLTGMNLDGNVSAFTTDVKYTGINMTDRYIPVMYEQTTAGTVSAEINFASQAYELADISDNDVIFEEHEWVDYEETVELSLYSQEYGNAEPIEITAGIVFDSGDPAGVSLTDADGNEIDVDGDGKFTVTASYTAYDPEDTTAQDVDLYVTLVNNDGTVAVYITYEPLTGGEIDYSNVAESIYFSMDTVYYANTVDGILSGLPSVKADLGE